MAAGDTDGDGKHALVAGGRTGGHVYPGIALAAELGRRRWKVSFVGLAGGLEERAAAEQGLPFHRIDAAPVVGASALGKLRSLTKVARASVSGRRLVVREKADVVVGLGGYVSVPTVVGARLAGRPILLFEPNAQPGVANRWMSRLADEAALAHSSAGGAMRCRTTVTGTPVRPEFFDQPAPSNVAGRRLRVLVLGGSQGARQLNQAMPAAIGAIEAAPDRLEVVHQCGPSHVETTEATYRDNAPQLADLRVVPFLDDMAGAMGRADLVVSRAGAITLAEICAVGRASLLLPLELAGAHQVDNANEQAAAGAARVAPSGAGAAELKAIVTALLEAPDELERMAAAAGRLGRPDAVARLADRVTSLVVNE